MASSSAEFSGPSRKGTKISRDADGNRVEEADGDVGIRTHDFSDETEINRKLFGEGTVPANVQRTSTHKNAQGDTVVESNDSNMGIRTHDYSDEAEINRTLFGEGATTQSKTSKTHSYKDKDGNTVLEAADGADTGIRTHDQSNQDEINARLFGEGAKNVD